MLRFMAWHCLRNDDYKGPQMVIVTGPNQDIAIKLIKRMKGLFEPLVNLIVCVKASNTVYHPHFGH
jgi:hypothetical protein